MLKDAARFADNISQLERGSLKAELDLLTCGRLQSTGQLIGSHGVVCLRLYHRQSPLTQV